MDPSTVLSYPNLNMRISNYGVQNAYRCSFFCHLELSQFPSDTDVGNVTQSVTDTILKSSRRAIVSPDNESQTQREHKRSGMQICSASLLSHLCDCLLVGGGGGGGG